MTFPIWWYTTFTEDNVCLEDFGLDNSTEFESSKQFCLGRTPVLVEIFFFVKLTPRLSDWTEESQSV